jgi:hypothetical protein
LALLNEAWAIRDDAVALPVEIGGKTFTPGIYRGDTIGITSDVTLNGPGEYIFQAATTITTGADITFHLTNGAKAEDVSWVPGTTMTIGADMTFEGNILAGTAILVGSNTIINGDILAGTAITFAAHSKVEGSILAGSAITFGEDAEVHGSVVAVTAITFGVDAAVTNSTDPTWPTLLSQSSSTSSGNNRRLRGSTV